MRILFVFIFIFIYYSLQAQRPVNDFKSLGELDIAYSNISNFNYSPDGQRKVENFSYSDVLGSPFWNNEWNAAVFVLTNGNIAKCQKSKLNLYSNEVHFINSYNVELSCDNNQIKKIYFYKGADTSKVVAVFESLLDPTNNKNAYYRILNGGKIRLLVLMKVLVRENDYNPMIGKKEYSFYSKSSYAIASNERVIPLKSLNQSSIFSALPLSIEYAEWLTQNRNKLRNEGEVISFFNFLNNLNNTAKSLMSFELLSSNLKLSFFK